MAVKMLNCENNVEVCKRHEMLPMTHVNSPTYCVEQACQIQCLRGLHHIGGKNCNLQTSGIPSFRYIFRSSIFPQHTNFSFTETWKLYRISYLICIGNLIFIEVGHISCRPQELHKMLEQYCMGLEFDMPGIDAYLESYLWFWWKEKFISGSQL